MNALHRTAVSTFAVALAIAQPLAMARGMSANPPEKLAKADTAASTARPDAKPIEDLQASTQRLRDAIHEMVNEPAGPKRNALIREGDRALAEVQSAMVNLPPQLLTAEATQTPYKDSGDELKRAAEDLHEAVQALAFDPDSKRRNESITKIRTATLEIQRLMHNIPVGTPGK